VAIDDDDVIFGGFGAGFGGGDFVFELAGMESYLIWYAK
jgi:hypothetical protein